MIKLFLIIIVGKLHRLMFVYTVRLENTLVGGQFS